MAHPSHRPSEQADSGHPHLREVGAAPLEQETTVATELSQTRRVRGIELPQAARALHLRLDQVKAIEEGRFDDLPGRPYVIGFIRSYAQYLGLDAQAVVGRFKEETSAFDGPQKLEFPSPANEGRSPGWLLLILALALAAAAYAGWYYLNTSDRVAIDEVSEVPESLIAETAPPPVQTQSEQSPATGALGVANAARDSAPEAADVATSVDIPAATAAAEVTEPVQLSRSEAAVAGVETSGEAIQQPETQAQLPRAYGPVDPDSRIVLRATEECWIQVTGPGDELVLTQFLHPGDTYHVPDRPGLVLTTGNAGGLDIMVDGIIAPSLGPSGAVRRGVMLDSDLLLAGVAHLR